MEVWSRPSLREYTTLRMGGHAECGLRLLCRRDWQELSGFLQRAGLSPLFMGRGSNLLPREGDLPYALVLPEPSLFLEVVQTEQDRVIVRAGAGAGLPRLLGKLRSMGLSGLEGLVGIPGSLGGAIAMNAGAFGYTLGSVLSRVQIWTPAQGLQWLNRDSLQCGYRSFDPGETDRWCIVAAELELISLGREEVGQQMRRCYAVKKERQPLRAWTCGCVFKNPEHGDSAGLLLDRAGFRGLTRAGVGFSSLHANFLLNHGQGSSDRALELIELARETVSRRFAVDLELEVQVV